MIHWIKGLENWGILAMRVRQWIWNVRGAEYFTHMQAELLKAIEALWSLKSSLWYATVQYIEYEVLTVLKQ